MHRLTRPIRAVALALVLAAPTALRAEPPVPTITVTGEGRVDAAPDMATVTLGVTTQARTASEALSSNSANLTTVLDNLRAAGIEARDIQTTGLSLNPSWQYDQSGGNGRITGYVASNGVTVRVRALDRLGAVLDAAVKDGANTLNGIEFGLAEPGPAMDEARKRAVEEARRRAELLTAAAGVKLGRIVTISEGGGYAPPMPMYRAEAASAAPVPVAAGEITTSASVTVVWELAP